jgi:hypothetical protein
MEWVHSDRMSVTYCPVLEDIAPVHGLHDMGLSEQDALHHGGPLTPKVPLYKLKKPMPAQIS